MPEPHRPSRRLGASLGLACTLLLAGLSACGSDSASGETSATATSTGAPSSSNTNGSSATGNTTTSGATATGGPTAGSSTSAGTTTGAGTTSAGAGGSSTTGGAFTSNTTGGDATATSNGTTSTTTTGGATTGGSTTGGSTTGGNGATTPVGKHGQLSVAGGKLVDEHGAAVTLRGQGFGWDNWWPQYYNADVVDWLRDDWCVDLVRPAMGIEPDGAFLQNAAASTARIQAVVDAAIAKEIYVIIDWHAHDIHQSEAVAFFSQMAETYGDHPNVIYEVFNEPEDDETWPQVKAYAETVIAAIRQHDPDNVVIVGSPEWDQRIDLVAQDPITSDPNVVYSLHFYAATHGQWLRDRAAEVTAAGIPLFVSESSGSEASGLGANDYNEWQAWFDLMDQHQISWINYSVSDKEGETISVLEPGAPANGGWNASQLTETGEYIRDVLRSYCE